MGSFFDVPHVHSWDRLVSRRQFLGHAAGATVNPGIPQPPDPSAGLFWTTHVPMDSIQVALDEAAASFQLSGFATLDFGNIKNAFLVTTPPVNATISLSMQWTGVKARLNIVDFETGPGLTANHRFAGQFIEDTATVEWSASVPSSGFTFQSDPAAGSVSKFAEIGRERNGVFFEKTTASG